MTKSQQYKIKWIDVFAIASWTTEEELTEQLKIHSQPQEQTLYYIKATPDFYIFTSGKPNDRNQDYGYLDIHAIPKGWIKSIKPAK